MITGFGRIAQELAGRLTAMGAFVIVCARNERQMQLAHDMGAHPMALSRIEQAAAQAEVIFNTVPARILSQQALARIDRQALLIELASPPYGTDIALAQQLGIAVALESGVPGRYAPGKAGEAMFEALEREMTRCAGMEGGRSDG